MGAAGRRLPGSPVLAVPVRLHLPGGHMQSDGASLAVRSFASPSPSFCLEEE